ncbi:MAG: transcriptional repressor NrdR [Nitrospirae bacterium]|nr:transcriptional repressor NrdR [Nitrospirota bacterium]
MKCPFCGYVEDRVVDSREGRDGVAIRRRRECLSCRRRFTTYERVEDMLPMVVKKDGRREVFDRQKIIQGLIKACEKRPVSMETIEEFVAQIEKKFQEGGEKEIPSSVIGQEVMQGLHQLDEVAYVRFASVYRHFKDINEFMEELKDMLSERKVRGNDPR